MKITNYTQFAKKTFLLGLDKRFFYFYAFCLFSLSFLALLLDMNFIYIIIFAVVSYVYFLIKFSRDPYWFEKKAINKSIRKKHKFYARTSHILSR